MTGSYRGGEFFVPADDPPPVPTPPPAPRERPGEWSGAIPVLGSIDQATAALPVMAASAASVTGGLILPPGVRSLGRAAPTRHAVDPVPPAPRPVPGPVHAVPEVAATGAWTPDWSTSDPGHGHPDDQHTAPNLAPHTERDVRWAAREAVARPDVGSVDTSAVWRSALGGGPGPVAPPWASAQPVAPVRELLGGAERRSRVATSWSRGQAVTSDLTSDLVMRPRPPRPEGGWRRTLFDLTAGRVNPGPGAAAAARADRHLRIRRPVRSCHRVAVLSVKGGVGKTTVASMLGLTFAQLRGDRVLTIDANPDLGTLADRLTGDTEVGMQHLLDFLSDRPAVSISDVEHFMSTNERLHVLAGSQEPCHGSAFTPDEYTDAIDALSGCYNVMIIDTGTGLSHAALTGVLATAHGVVIVGEPTVDAASRASMTLDWLAGSGYEELAANAIVVMNQDRGSAEIDGDVVREHFCPPRCAAVVEVPDDPHLGNGGRIDTRQCRPRTIDVFEEVAATIADSFPAPHARGTSAAGGSPSSGRRLGSDSSGRRLGSDSSGRHLGSGDDLYSTRP